MCIYTHIYHICSVDIYIHAHNYANIWKSFRAILSKLRRESPQVALPPAFFQLSVEALKAILCIVALTTRKGLPGRFTNPLWGLLLIHLGGNWLEHVLKFHKGLLGVVTHYLSCLPFLFIFFKTRLSSPSVNCVGLARKGEWKTGRCQLFERVGVDALHLQFCHIFLQMHPRSYSIINFRDQKFPLGGGFKNFSFSPRSLGKMNPFWRSYFSNEWVGNHQLVLTSQWVLFREKSQAWYVCSGVEWLVAHCALDPRLPNSWEQKDERSWIFSEQKTQLWEVFFANCWYFIARFLFITEPTDFFFGFSWQNLTNFFSRWRCLC